MNSTFTRPLLLAALVLGGAASACGGTPEVELDDPLRAAPAERLQIRELAWGETFGEVLAEHLTWDDQQDLLTAFRRQGNPRSMREGAEITFRYVGESDLRGIDVALDRDESIRLTRALGGWESSIVQTPVYTDTIWFSGEIESSLWSSVVDDPGLTEVPYGDRVELINDLDRVLQWQIDFSRQVQLGDYYRVAYERDVRPDGTMRRGTILAAEFVNVGTPYHAIWFDPNDDGEGSWFDLEGRSVRRAFILKPIEFARISSRFSRARRHPILNTIRAHRGVDYAANTGTPIMATADGVVVKRGPNGGLGNAIEIRHPNGFVTRYGHMSSFASGISVGTRVRQEQVIGYVGMTGLATGPHLHYEMIRNGSHVDPLAVDLPAGDPVPADSRDAWMAEMQPRLALLEQLPPPGLQRFADVEAAQTDRVVERPGVDGSDRLP